MNIFKTVPDATPVLIRIMVGLVFFSEGCQKFLKPEAVGAGRFDKIGLPYPELLASFVGSVEIGCGLLVVFGFLTRIAAIPLFVIMVVAIITTKMPILLNEGFWNMAHASRTDWCMLIGSLYLFITGAGRWSLDYSLRNHSH